MSGTWRAKPQGSGELKPMPRDLQAEFESLDLPQDRVYCCEWIGNRMVEHKPEHRLYVWDWYPLGQPCPPFAERHIGLGALMAGTPNKVHFVPYQASPGLVDLFAQQMLDPLSEGLVIRRFDSKVIGHPTRCKDNPHVLKCKYRDIRELKGRP